MTLPKVIYVGTADYEVKQKGQLDLLGETRSEHAEILIRRKQAPSVKRETLMHELLHAIIYASGMVHHFKLDHDTEEELVSALSPWILQLLRDNPYLVEYLTERA